MSKRSFSKSTLIDDIIKGYKMASHPLAYCAVSAAGVNVSIHFVHLSNKNEQNIKQILEVHGLINMLNIIQC